MAGEVIRTFDSLAALGEFIDAGADGKPSQEVPFRDENGQPLTAEQMLELARRIERETGHRLIFRPGERGTTG